VYRINEIFYSLQGEGFWTGTPMVFVRMSGCNLHCPFCDTDHLEYHEMGAEEIVEEAVKAGGECGRVCVTGGEPSMQLDHPLVDALHRAGFKVHIETNGTRALPEGVDWITLSPKEDVDGLKGTGKVVLKRADEIKVVYQGDVNPRWTAFPADWHFLQPCDTGDPSRNGELIAETIGFIQRHPRWRLSLQTHKLLNIR